MSFIWFVYMLIAMQIGEVLLWLILAVLFVAFIILLVKYRRKVWELLKL